jgi:SAM-dependent methyltransferase
MEKLPLQTDYWDSVASKKSFAHPLRVDWLRSYLKPEARILDHGCGYGRLLEQFAGAGYSNVVGTDFSGGMLAQCRARLPEAMVVRNDGRVLPFCDRSFDAVVLFTVLTCIPSDEDQIALLAEIRRTLRPKGLLYISDLLLNSDDRNIDRYECDAVKFDRFGVFQLPEGAIVRHHDRAWIEQLTISFSTLAFEKFTAKTMNGNESAAFQYLGRLGI